MLFGLMAAIKAAWTIILTVWFVSWLSKHLFDVAAVYAQAEGGAVPNLDLVGTDVLGKIAAVIVPVVFVSFWVPVFLGIFQAILSWPFKYGCSILGINTEPSSC